VSVEALAAVAVAGGGGQAAKGRVRRQPPVGEAVPLTAFFQPAFQRGVEDQPALRPGDGHVEEVALVLRRRGRGGRQKGSEEASGVKAVPERHMALRNP